MDNAYLEPFGIKSTLNRRLGLSPQELREVTWCPSGFTLQPKDKPTQSKLLALEEDILTILKAQKVETHVVWHHYMVEGCPRRVMSTEGLTIDITDTTVAEEVEAQTGAGPVKFVLSKRTAETDAETTWLVSFAQAIGKPFRLFAHSLNSRRTRRDPTIQQCGGCFRFHGSNFRCDSKTCVNCARLAHEGPCDKQVPKCVNCRGPHAANYGKCPARPQVVGGVIQKHLWEQLREIKLAGDRARSRAVNESRKTANTETSARTNQDSRTASNGLTVGKKQDTSHSREPDTIAVCQ